MVKSGKEQLSKVQPLKKLISFAKLISACERINFKPRQELLRHKAHFSITC